MEQMSGFALTERLRDGAASTPGWSDGMLYPLLHHLERSGHIRGEWNVTPDGKRHKSYSLKRG